MVRAMTHDQRLLLLTNYSICLANEGFLKREDVIAAVDTYFNKLEQKIPLCLSTAKPNDPPPPNWRAVWRAYSL